MKAGGAIGGSAGVRVLNDWGRVGGWVGGLDGRDGAGRGKAAFTWRKRAGGCYDLRVHHAEAAPLPPPPPHAQTQPTPSTNNPPIPLSTEGEGQICPPCHVTQAPLGQQQEGSFPGERRLAVGGAAVDRVGDD